MRNLSMKKFGTPIGAAPGVAREKLGFAGVGTPSGRRTGRRVSTVGVCERAWVRERPWVRRGAHPEVVVETEPGTDERRVRVRLPPLPSRQPSSVMRPEPARPLRRAVPLRLRPPVRSRPTAPGVAAGVAPGATTVCTGEGKGVGVAGVLNGVEDAAGVAVGVVTCAEAVGVGVCAIAVAAGVSVVVAVALGLAVPAGSWASAMPPTTAAYRPAQHRAMARIFLSDKLALIHARGP